MKNAWEYVQDWDVELVGPDVRDPEELRRWSLAFSIAGGLPYIWREVARPISEIIYGLLEVRRGDHVLIIGEAVAPSGWADDIRELVGDSGRVDVVEIIRDGREAVENGLVGRNGMRGSWQWQYTDGMDDESYDCIGILQSTQHCDDWTETGRELLRVMKPGRRIVFAEALLTGPRFEERMNADVHLRQWANKAMETRHNLGEISHYSGEELMGMLGDLVDDPQCMEWRGIEMFWGRKKH